MPVNAEITQISAQLNRMQRMFTAYRPMLGPRGHNISSIVDQKISQIQKDKADTGGAERLAELMPRPGARIDLKSGGEDNWYRWFDLDRFGIKVGPIGSGCIQPCGPCCQGNGMNKTETDILPVVVNKMGKAAALVEQDGDYLGWEANDLMSWNDPFFGASIDTVIDHNLRSFRKQIIYLQTRGWDPTDQRTQAAAQNLARLQMSTKVVLSFHLGLSSPDYDIIRAVYINGPDHSIPNETLQNYAHRTANIIRTLNGNIGKLIMFHRPMIDIEAGKSDAEHYELSTVEAFMLAMRELGVKEEDSRSVMERYPLRTRILGETGTPLSDGLAVEFDCFDFRFGKSRDFFSRFQKARRGDPDCLKQNIKTFEDKESRPGRNYPRVRVSGGGHVSIVSPDQTEPISFGTLDSLDPLEEKQPLIG